MTVTERLIPARQWTSMPHFLERASSEEEGGNKEMRTRMRDMTTDRVSFSTLGIKKINESEGKVFLYIL